MSEQKPPSDLIPAATARKLLQCSAGTLARWIADGKLAGFKRGGRWFLSEADCHAFFRQHDPATVKRPMTSAERSFRDAWTDAILRAAGVRK